MTLGIDAGLPVRAFFTDRAGGLSRAPYDSLNLAVHVGDSADAVAANRARVEAAAGAPVTFLVADHGNRVAHVTGPGFQPPAADALVTTVPGVALAAIAADCVPVLLAAPRVGAVAAVHCGRAGLVLGVVDRAVEALVGLGADPAHVVAAVGPAICGKCYEVPESMRDEVCRVVPAAWSQTSGGTAGLDIPGAVVAGLAASGVAEVVRRDLCTREEPAYFSHRRDGVTGRFAGVIVCPG